MLAIQSDLQPDLQPDFFVQNLLLILIIAFVDQQLAEQQKADRPGEAELEFSQFRKQIPGDHQQESTVSTGELFAGLVECKLQG